MKRRKKRRAKITKNGVTIWLCGCNGVLTFLCIFASLSRSMMASCSRVTSFVTNMLKSNRKLLVHFNSAPSIISKTFIKLETFPCIVWSSRARKLLSFPSRELLLTCSRDFHPKNSTSKRSKKKVPLVFFPSRTSAGKKLKAILIHTSLRPRKRKNRLKHGENKKEITLQGNDDAGREKNGYT